MKTQTIEQLSGLPSLILSNVGAVLVQEYAKFSNSNFLKSYGWDVASPIWLYSLVNYVNNRTGKHLGIFGKASISFAVPAILEVFQKMGVYPGAYDTKDFLAYGAGVLVAAGIDKIVSSKSGLENKLAQENQ